MKQSTQHTVQSWLSRAGTHLPRPLTTCHFLCCSVPLLESCHLLSCCGGFPGLLEIPVVELSHPLGASNIVPWGAPQNVT